MMVPHAYEHVIQAKMPQILAYLCAALLTFTLVSASQSPLPSLKSESRYGPWSARPSCIQELNSTDKLCVFTSASFANNRGISIITTSDKANRILLLPIFSNPRSHLHVQRERLPKPYASRQLPGRGIGLVANRTLQRGEMIFASAAVIIIERDIHSFKPSDRLPLTQLAVRRLPQKTQDMILQLWGHFGGDPVDDIINTNSFGVDVFEGSGEREYIIVVPEISVSST
jgi:hypothetical protein